MITSITATKFSAVPYLETAQIMRAHPQGLTFSATKPNVIVGPNGAGKSALLKALALQTLAYYTGESALDRNYINGREADAYWAEKRESWTLSYEFLPGLVCDTDNAAALYYRPGHIPGNEVGITHAMMLGYSDEAREYGRMIKDKSSGQKSQALLEKLHSALTGESGNFSYGFTNWRASRKLLTEAQLGPRPSQYQMYEETLKKRYLQPQEGAVPVLLMDEPEQSVDTGRVQVIVATHSLYPLLHPHAFNLIEAAPGYVAETRELLGLTVHRPAGAQKEALKGKNLVKVCSHDGAEYDRYVIVPAHLNATTISDALTAEIVRLNARDASKGEDEDEYPETSLVAFAATLGCYWVVTPVVAGANWD
jgi:energy-coupling factor transporter ATP-binding protein EcfA2